MKDAARRRFLVQVAAGIALPAATLPAAVAQINQLDPLVWEFTKGVPVQRGRVKLELPLLVDNGNAVPLTVSVDSPMTPDNYVSSIHLFSQRNPVRDMARFFFTPRSGRAKVSTRVRLAGSQNVTAIAVLSDGTFWVDSAHVLVTLSACMDES
jgi:sulfur-oxidizing protein SoxY